jgi:hypothetical protein
MLVLLVTSPRRITRLLVLLLSSLAVAKHLYIAGILLFVIASCLLNYPLIHPQFRSYLECKTFSGLATLRLPLRYISEVPRCVISVHRCASTLYNGRATLRSKGDLLPTTINISL